ncbi:MAG: response regulator [Chitinivibrionales bacterium]|nr:response regulator [Chitinivibrionales bacterium]MBD3356549.1 response regulator [Chitinivibrionales bacterium]
MNILIVEDERVAARHLERMVRDVLGDKIGEVHRRETLDDSEDCLSSNRIDVLLLDLNLQGQDGFDLLRRAVAESFQTIVVSANTDRALEAYEYGVLDFVPKPLDRERLSRAFQRLERPGGVSAKMLVIRNHGRLQIVPVEQISYLKGAGDYAEIHLYDGGLALHGKSLEQLERILPSHFVRIHKSYIADMHEALTLHVHGGGKYELETRQGLRLPVSRMRYRELRERLES